jgi:hypothetical protein
MLNSSKPLHQTQNAFRGWKQRMIAAGKWGNRSAAASAAAAARVEGHTFLHKGGSDGGRSAAAEAAMQGRESAQTRIMRQRAAAAAAATAAGLARRRSVAGARENKAVFATRSSSNPGHREK